MGRPLAIAFVVLLALAAVLMWALSTLDAPNPVPDIAPSPTAPTVAEPATAADTRPASGVAANATPPAEAAAPDAARTAVVDPAVQARLRVRVVDADKQPIADATIETFADTTPGVTRTDADGRATLPGPIRGDTRRLLVRAGDRHAQGYWPFSPDLEITLKWFGPVRGRVVDRATGAAIAGAKVMRPHHQCKHCELDVVIADANGAFELPAVPRDEDTVFAFSAEGYGRQNELLRIPGKGDPLVHTFVLQRGSVVTGRCVDLTTRRSLAGVRVSIQGATLGETAADGTFRLSVMPTNEGTATLQFEHPDHCRVTSTVPVPQPDPAVEFPLPRAVSLAGRVATPSGAPVAGARVRALGNEGFDVPGMPARSRVSAVSDDTPVTADADGAFVLTRLTPGAGYHLYATHDDYGPTPTARGMAIAECKDDAPPVVILLEPKSKVTAFGSIVGTFRCNGEPRGGQLTWHWQSLRGSCRIPNDGSIRCDKVPAEQVRVAVMPEPFASSGTPPDGVEWRGTVDVLANSDAALDVVHEFPEGTISGRVTFADGAPAARHSVFWSYERVGANARTDDDGRYVLRIPLTSGEVTVGCQDGSGTKTALLGAVGVDFVVPREVSLRMRARDDAGTRLNFSYSVRRAGEAHVALQPAPILDPEGFVSLQFVEGAHSVLLAASGCAASLHSIDLRHGARNELDVVLPRGVAVTFRLHGENASPPAASVRVIDPLFGDLPTQSSRMLFLPDKRHLKLTHAGTTLVGFGPGTHRLVCNDENIELEPKTFAVGTSPIGIDVKWRERPK